VAEWALDMQRRRWTRILPLSRLRAIGLHRQPSAHAVGTYAVRAIPRHTDETHREALALLDELLAMGFAGSSLTAPDAAEVLPPALYPTA
jgi:hypothetical protein